MLSTSRVETKKELLLWLSLFVTSMLTVHVSYGVVFLIIAILINVLDKCKNNDCLSDRLLYILIFYLPFYTLIRLVLIQMGLEPISVAFNYFRDLCIIGALIVVIAQNGFRITLHEKVWFIFIGIYFIGFLLSILYRNYSIGLAGLHLSFIPMLAYIVVMQDKSKNNIDSIFRCLLQVILIAAIVGIYTYFVRPKYYGQLFTLSGNVVDYNQYVRLFSLFFTPNVCGSFLAVGFAICLSKLLSKIRIKYAIIALFLLVCIILTLSRGSWFFTISSMLICLLLTKPKYAYPLIALLLIVYLITESSALNLNLFGPTLDRIVSGRFLSLFDFNDNSSYGRVNYWKTAFELLRENIIGYGLGVCGTGQIGRENLTNLLVIDGYYVKTIVEFGLFGFVYLVFFIFWVIKQIYTQYSKYHNELSTLSIMVTIGFLLQCIGSNPLDFVCVSPWFWIILALDRKQDLII